MNYRTLFGKKIKEGTLNAQDKSEEWVPCNVVVREHGITFAFTSKRNDNPKGEDTVNGVMEFSSPQDVEVLIMPDHARRSRESKLFPFSIRKKFNKDNTMETDTTQLPKHEGLTYEDEVILATMDGRTMWEWASIIKCLGNKSKEENIPLFHEASTISYHNEHYENPCVLQDVLLKMFTYKNLPKNPVTFDDIAAINRFRGNYLSYIDYPSGFTTVFEDEEERDGNETVHNEDDSWIQNSSSKYQDLSYVENHQYLFGLFAYLVLVGSCVQVNEKCFELITSTNLYDLSTQAKWKGNSPFSMLCEGDYNTSRNYMVQALWKLGYPKLDKFRAGCSRSKSFSIFVSKPSSLWGVGNVTGQPVHLEDQKLCRLLRKNGDGREENKILSQQLIESSNMNLAEFESPHWRRITAVNIPQSVMQWGSTTLTTLNLAYNGIFELPDELYEFVNLTHLDVSGNCLFGLSHKLGNLTRLKSLYISTNLIAELPDSIERLEEITDFECRDNPITKPPSAVWSRGIANVRSFFTDMRESGTEKNVDLRVLVLGLSEAGKTSLINGLIQPDKKALTRVGDRTVGIEKRTWVMSRNEKEAANLLIYDFAGQEEYYITHHLFLGSKALYILAFDLSKYEDRLLDQQIILWWDSIQNRVSDIKSNDSKTPKVIIVGTHADVLGNDAQGCADCIHKNLEKRFHLRTTSIQDRIQILDEKLAKLDPMRKKKERALDAKKKEYEILPLGIKLEMQTLECEMGKLRHQQQCTIALPSRIHAVSSKDFRNLDKLKEQIASSLTEIGPSGKYFPQLDEYLPASWFRLRKFVREQSTRKGRECMKLPQYFKLISDELGINEDVGLRATRFCHELGDILFFEKEGLIFLRPSLLIDVFKLVIRHDHKESTYWKTDMLKQQIDEEKFNIGKHLLLQKGELDEWLLDVLWLPIQDDLGLESNIKNNLIQLLETFDIATPIEYKGHKRLLIPEFQPKTISQSWPEHNNQGDFEMQGWICADHNLPQGLLKRIQVRVMKKIFKRKKKEFNLAQNEFLIKDNEFTTLYCKSGASSKGFPGFGVSEGIRIYVRGKTKSHVSSLLSKVQNCVKDTLRDFPGLIFDHYAVQISKIGPLFIKMEELKARYDAGEMKVFLSPIQNKGGHIKGEDVDIKNLLPGVSIGQTLHL